jgi:hypothetical protein
MGPPTVCRTHRNPLLWWLSVAWPTVTPHRGSPHQEEVVAPPHLDEDEAAPPPLDPLVIVEDPVVAIVDLARGRRGSRRTHHRCTASSLRCAATAGAS